MVKDHAPAISTLFAKYTLAELKNIWINKRTDKSLGKSVRDKWLSNLEAAIQRAENDE